MFYSCSWEFLFLSLSLSSPQNSRQRRLVCECVRRSQSLEVWLWSPPQVVLWKIHTTAHTLSFLCFFSFRLQCVFLRSQNYWGAGGESQKSTMIFQCVHLLSPFPSLLEADFISSDFYFHSSKPTHSHSCTLANPRNFSVCNVHPDLRIPWMAYSALHDLAFAYLFTLMSCYSVPCTLYSCHMAPLLFLNWNHVLSLASRSLLLSRTSVFPFLLPLGWLCTALTWFFSGACV